MQNHKTKNTFKTLDKLTRILPFMFWMLILFGFGEPYVAILTLVSAILHEASHAAAALFCGGARIRARLYGFGMKPKRMLSYKQELLIASAGPGANLCLFALLLPLCRGSHYLTAFAIINLLTAISNLLPIEGNDGYRILLCVFSENKLLGCERALPTFSVLILFTLSVISLYAVSRLNSGYFPALSLLFLLLKSIDRHKGGILREKESKREL